MGYVDKSEHIANACSISKCTWKWTKKMLSPLGPFSSEKFLSPLVAPNYPTDFRLALVRDLTEEGGRVP
jgi:hypothetical protein